MERRTLARAAPPACGGEPDARISVIVLTHSRAAELARTLHQLCALPERPPLIVVDNDSQDDTAAMVERDFPDAVLIRAPHNLGAAGRNLGAAAARTPYIAFCDDDTWWAPGSLAAAADLFDRHRSVAALTARVLVGAERREDPTSSQMAASPLPPHPDLPGTPILGLLAGASAFRTSAFLAMGGYHPRFFLGGEEAVLALDLASAGWSLLYQPQLTVFHHPSPLRNPERRQRLLARNAVWTAWLRLPAASAIWFTLRSAPQVWQDAGGIRGWWETLRGWRWVRRQRRVLPPAVDALRLLLLHRRSGQRPAQPDRGAAHAR